MICRTKTCVWSAGSPTLEFGRNQNDRPVQYRREARRIIAEDSHRRPASIEPRGARCGGAAARSRHRPAPRPTVHPPRRSPVPFVRGERGVVPPDDVPLEARPPRLADLVALCRRLNEAGARYIVIGGMAVIQAGFVRATEDIDLLIDTSPANIARVREALRSLPDKAVD